MNTKTVVILIAFLLVVQVTDAFTGVMRENGKRSLRLRVRVFFSSGFLEELLRTFLDNL